MDKLLKIQTKRNEEQQTVTFMIQMYCKGVHKTKNALTGFEELCPDCKKLARYAINKSSNCPYIAKGTKTFCNSCKTPCYSSTQREQIKKVMRYSGPRIIFFYPGKVLYHAFCSIKKR